MQGNEVLESASNKLENFTLLFKSRVQIILKLDKYMHINKNGRNGCLRYYLIIID